MNESMKESMKESIKKSKDDRWVTIPNALCLFRLFGSLTLIPAAIMGRPYLVLSLYLLLALTDLVDGKIARWFDQKSRIGPKLDSLADVTMYAVLLFALIWLRGEVLARELPWLVPPAVMFGTACAAALIKFGSLPSYHTRSAKTAWFLTLLAAISLFLDWSVWPLRIAALSVFVANLESTAITATLSEPKTDVISLRAARRQERVIKPRTP